MNLDAVLARGRAAAERLMVDTVVVDRQTGTVRNETTGALEPVYSDPLYEGKARVQQQRTVSEEDTGAGRIVTTLQRELQMPITVTGLKVDDRVRVTASVDPDLAGRTFRVSSLFGKTHATARRVAVEEVTS